MASMAMLNNQRVNSIHTRLMVKTFTQYQYLMISMGMNGQNHMFNGQNCQNHS